LDFHQYLDAQISAQAYDDKPVTGAHLPTIPRAKTPAKYCRTVSMGGAGLMGNL